MPPSDPKQPLRDLLEHYLEALYTQDYQAAYDYMYKPDVEEFRETIIEFAKKMDVFGETDDLLKRLRVPDIAAMEALSPSDFMAQIMRMVEMEIGKEDLQKILTGIRILSVDETDYMSIVHYEVPMKYLDEWEALKSQVEMIFSENRWQILFKSGMRMGLQHAQKEIDQYYERKSRDRVDLISEDQYLSAVTLTGYVNEHEEIVFVPRFKEGREFSEGLAAVKIMRYFGYIDRQGEIAIKPRYIDAEDFSEGRAAVRILNDERERLWGFIDKTGEMIVPAQFETTAAFSEGRCAVQKGDKWGYIDETGKVVIPFSFETAGEFSGGQATVELITKDGDWHEMEIDLAGNVIG